MDSAIGIRICCYFVDRYNAIVVEVNSLAGDAAGACYGPCVLLACRPHRREILETQTCRVSNFPQSSPQPSASPSSSLTIHMSINHDHL